jgi:hypothetical protein
MDFSPLRSQARMPPAALSRTGIRETVARRGRCDRTQSHFKDTMSGDDGFDWSEIECLLRRAYWSLKAAVADG